MLSRVGDSIYWLSRYVERAENVARFIDVTYNLSLGDSGTLEQAWESLVYTTGDYELFTENYDSPARENVLRFLAFDERNPNSIISCISGARENGRTVREVISSAMWEELNKFYFMVRAAASNDLSQDQPQEFFERVKIASQTIVGATDATMSHGEAWHFSRIGRLIERADKTSRIVDVQYFILLPAGHDVGTNLDVIRWSALLRSTSALEMYRRMHGRIVPLRVADFLILDRQFPRSIRFCLSRAQESLAKITGSEPGTFRGRAEQQMGRLRAQIDYTSIEDIIDRGLHEYIDDFQRRLNDVGEAISEEFFIIKKPTQSQQQAPQMQYQTQTSI